MRRAPILIVLVLATSGCIPPAGSQGIGIEEEFASTLAARQLENPERLSWTLQNGNGEVLSLECGDGRCGIDRAFRVEALQGDGSWVERSMRGGLVLDEDLTGDLLPWDETAVAEGRLEEPGLYRAVIRVNGPDGPVDVGREVAVVGWPAETTAQGVALLDRADAAECSAVAARIWDGLLRHAEPDDVTDLLESTNDEHRRWAVLEHMLQRGTFVDELSIELTTASMDDVLAFGHLLSQEVSGIQEPLRALVAERLLEALDRQREVLSAEHIRIVGRLLESWPPEGPGVVVARLERGPEAEDALAELIDITVYATGGLFSPYAEDILAALEVRCEGTSEETALGQACERARRYFDPGFMGGFGRGFSISCTCGGYLHARPGTCAEIGFAFTDLLREAGAPQVRVLDGAAWSVPAPAEPL